MVQFTKLGKSVNDLFKKKYDWSTSISTKNTAGNVTVEAGATRGDALAGYTTATLKDSKWGEVEVTMKTDTGADIPTGKVTLNKLSPGLEIAIKGSASKLNIDATLKKDAATLTAGVSTNMKDKHGLTASAVISNDGLSVGGSVALNGSGDVTDYNVGTEWAAKDLTLTLVTSNKGENITASAFQKLNGSVLGAQYSLNPENNSRSMQVGTRYNLAEGTLVQAKLNSAGEISTVVEHRLATPNCLLCVSTSHNALAKGSDVLTANKMGVSMKFGDQ